MISLFAWPDALVYVFWLLLGYTSQDRVTFWLHMLLFSMFEYYFAPGGLQAIGATGAWYAPGTLCLALGTLPENITCVAHSRCFYTAFIPP